MIFNNKKMYSKKQKAELWEQYTESGFKDETIRNEILESNIDLVEIVVSNLMRSFPDYVEAGDLITDGYMGLVEALDSFDPDKGFKFETFAVRRISGSILDGLRASDTMSRHYRSVIKVMYAAKDYLTSELQREPSRQDILDHLNWSEKQFITSELASEFSIPANIDDNVGFDGEEYFSHEAVLPDETLDDFSDLLFKKDLQEDVTLLVEELDAIEQIVLYLYIEGNMNFSAISKVLGISYPSVSKSFRVAVEKISRGLRLL